MIKVVIFDVDGVLIDTYDATLKFLQNLMIIHGYSPPSYEEYKKLYHLTMKDAIRVLTKSQDEEEIQRIFMMRAKRELTYPIELVKSPIRMKETIISLAQKYLLGIVTNKIKNNIFEVPEMQEIEKYFTGVIAFEDIRKPKPDPESLFLMLKTLNITAEEAVYIGDAVTDAQAARAAGIQFILFPKSNVEGVAISTDIFEKLPEIISKLAQ